ncbi:hypothetical protein [Verrucosispora sp. NA02020]|uniref:hypothetical protein n=1 Tax=Verrucosispora sp. NA02020 TaxID=2742132 RepID=UPI00158FCC31|nr:hypothetical protein [Verrucosispora sp. NA02020]QKW16712.1 hypothetical protein HUT12_30875 [Verrucosispora sp. NA02020]
MWIRKLISRFNRQHSASSAAAQQWEAADREAAKQRLLDHARSLGADHPDDGPAR